LRTRSSPVPDLSAANVETVMRRAQDGDELAWRELERRYGRLIRSILRSYRLPGPAADDVGQTVWLYLWQNRDRIREPERLAGWLGTTTRREAARMLARSARQTPVDRTDQLPDIEPGPEDRALDRQEHREVRIALARLDIRSRELLDALSADSGSDYESVARRLNRPVGSIGPTRRRSLDKLRISLATA
jgi:RNA polymerase sigma factor (sigma-70 family)